MNTLKSITPLQWLGIILIVNGALIGGTANLTDLFGTQAAHIIVSVASLGNSVVGGVITFLTGQGNMVRSVAAMPGVQSITVNSAANQTLAQLAVDQSQTKVAPSPAAAATVQATAKSGT